MQSKKEICRRKRLYRRAKLSNNCNHWSKFKSVRNNVTSLIRQSKSNYYERLSSKLNSGLLSSRDWWKTLKSMMTSHNLTSIPPLFDISNDLLIMDENEKANVLNNYFANQSFVDDYFTTLPDESFYFTHDTLDAIHVMPFEVFDVLKTLKAGKASGPDGINNKSSYRSSWSASTAFM